MPGKRVSMRKTREVLRLYFDLKLGQRQIARSANVSQSTVHDYLERFTAAGLSWPLARRDVGSRIWKRRCFPPIPAKAVRPPTPHPLPDFAHIHEELQRHKHTTRQLLWEEYRAAHPDGYELQPFLLSLPALETRTGSGAAPRASSGREAVRRLGWRDHSPSRSPDRRNSPRLRCSWRCSAPATTPTPKPTKISRWSPGSVRTCAPSSSWAAAQNWWCPTTPKPE